MADSYLYIIMTDRGYIIDNDWVHYWDKIERKLLYMHKFMNKYVESYLCIYHTDNLIIVMQCKVFFCHHDVNINIFVYELRNW